MDRLSSMMLIGAAEKFLRAAEVTHAAHPDDGFAPTLFLCAQSIELSLKGYLRGSGSSKAELKKYGHDIMETLAAANERGLPDIYLMSEDEFASVVLIEKHYWGKDLQYPEAGFKQYPKTIYLLNTARRLWSCVRPFCVAKRDFHVGKESAVK